MKRIATASEPLSFRSWRSEHPHASWEEFKHACRGPEGIAAEVYRALERAQRGLCAYCEIDLRPPLGAEVEHVFPKSRSTPEHNWGLDFSNFVAGCEGAQRPKELPERSMPPLRQNLHCGARKTDQDLTDATLDPREIPRSPALWDLTVDGRLLENPERCAQAGVDPRRAAATLEALGLNVPVLRRLRAAARMGAEDAFLATWDGTDADERHAWRRATPAMMDLQDGRLAPFWTTLRLVLGLAAEEHLSRHPDLL